MTRLHVVAVLFLALLVAGCTGEGAPVDTQVAEIFVETQGVPAAGAGQFYNETILFGTGGGAALPDRFELTNGVLPPGVTLINDRGLDGSGNPDPDGSLTGYARLIGFPREQGDYDFTIKAISTGALGGLAQVGPGPGLDQPDVSTSADYTLSVGEGSINFMTPTAKEGTADPAVPAFPDVIDFVNPANPQAFFSFAFEVAGGSGNNIVEVFMPRELELSVFDVNVVAGIDTLETDTDETAGSGNKFEADFADGGWFTLQAGNSKVQVGGFQAPRGPVGKITTLDGDWFQRTPGQNGPALNSRRTLGDNVPGGDTTLGTPLPVNFSDPFDPRYEGTHAGFTAPPGQLDLTRRKYPFTAGNEYQNAFFADANEITPLRFRIIAQARDTRGTLDTNLDDIYTRKAYDVQVKIPNIVVDTVVLPGGTAGLDYTEFMNASGGVPPLSFDVEGIDGDTSDFDITPGHPLTIDDFNVEVDQLTGQFFGVPSATGIVEVSMRVYAAVMNPTQSGAVYVSTAPGEGDGTHPVSGLSGSHRTYQVAFAPPSAPSLGNLSLNPGVDGQPYPTDRLFGAGGVPNLVPKPVGFVGTYPSAQVARTYTYTASYIRDDSHADQGNSVGGLPNFLILDGDAASPTNGQITGTTTDRGFHPVLISLTDFFRGAASAPSLDSSTTVSESRTLSVSPDSAIYLRGDQDTGGEKTGLLSATDQMSEGRMVPIFLAAGVYRSGSDGASERISAVPQQIDLLPVMLANGGSDAHVDKSIPSDVRQLAGRGTQERPLGVLLLRQRRAVLRLEAPAAGAHLDSDADG